MLHLLQARPNPLASRSMFCLPRRRCLLVRPPLLGRLVAYKTMPTVTDIGFSAEKNKETVVPAVTEAKEAMRIQFAAIAKNRWLKLIKLELNALVCFTSAGGYVLTGGSLFDFRILSLCVGTMLSASSAAVFNQIKERHFDANMARTKNRPLVSGSISVRQAQLFAWTTGIAGVGLLYVGTTPSTAALSLVTMIIYTRVYTPLKRVTCYNTEVGALVGSIPPLMGWTAAMGETGLFGWEALFLATTLYSWQMHHFMTIAWLYRHDYEKANFVIQSVGDKNGVNTTTKGLAWATFMLTLPLISYGSGFTSPMFCVSGTIVNLCLVLDYDKFYRNPNSRTARKAMLTGIWQLVFFFALMVVHIKNKDDITAFRQLRVFSEHCCAYVNDRLSLNSLREHWYSYFFAQQPEKKLNKEGHVQVDVTAQQSQRHQQRLLQARAL
eukprot:gb/GEZN01006521.1/.p1 GENE.gb/GEZN01006521.1/~~gb/GEZN01006521.1/.p1  ORF type:complete len:438 (+),score=35.16 gb/GEZN01006521.1/:94-1407(+)